MTAALLKNTSTSLASDALARALAGLHQTRIDTLRSIVEDFGGTVLPEGEHNPVQRVGLEIGRNRTVARKHLDDLERFKMVRVVPNPDDPRKVHSIVAESAASELLALAVAREEERLRHAQARLPKGDGRLAVTSQVMRPLRTDVLKGMTHISPQVGRRRRVAA